MKTKRERWK